MSRIFRIVPWASMKATESGMSVFFIHMLWYAGSSKMKSMPSLRPRLLRFMRPRARSASLATTSTLRAWGPTRTVAVLRRVSAPAAVTASASARAARNRATIHRSNDRFSIDRILTHERKPSPTDDRNDRAGARRMRRAPHAGLDHARESRPGAGAAHPGIAPDLQPRRLPASGPRRLHRRLREREGHAIRPQGCEALRRRCPVPDGLERRLRHLRKKVGAGKSPPTRSAAPPRSRSRK